MSESRALGERVRVGEREQRVVTPLEADRGERVAGETAAADRAAVVARIEDDIVGQLEQPAQTFVQQPRLPARVAGDMQVGATDVTDQQRVAAEHKPRLLAAPPPIRERVGVMCGRMTRCRDRRHDRVAELDRLAVGKRDVIEVDPRARGQVGGRAGALDQRRQPGDVVGLHVRLEHGHDRRADRGGRGHVVVDQVGVRVDDRERAVGGAAEQVAGTGAGVVQKRAQQHLVSPQLVISTGSPARRHSG